MTILIVAATPRYLHTASNVQWRRGGGGEGGRDICIVFFFQFRDDDNDDDNDNRVDGGFVPSLL